MKAADWVVIGGGVVGLACAWQFARAGQSVIVLEAGSIGEGTSTKAAGMLLPEVEAIRRREDPSLLKESFDLYPAFLTALEASSGRRVPFHRRGCVAVAPADAFPEVWTGVTPDPPEVWRRHAPSLAEELAGAYFAEAAEVDAEALVFALFAACRRERVEVREGALVTQIRHAGDRWLKVRTPGGWVEGERFLLATGAWSDQLAAELGLELGVYPVKGQMVELFDPEAELTSIVFGPDVYLCPKGDGRLLVGATMEEAGFDRSVRAGAVARLLEAACRLYPRARDLLFRRAWAGLRPGRAGLPVIDAVAQNAYAAVGHFRNGILLTPLTVERLMRMAGLAA